jgi:hypothetical protein
MLVRLPNVTLHGAEAALSRGDVCAQVSTRAPAVCAWVSVAWVHPGVCRRPLGWRSDAAIVSNKRLFEPHKTVMLPVIR